MNWFFDAIIFGFLIADIAFIIFLWKRGETFFPAFINDALIFLALIAWGVIAYGSFVEPKQIAIREQSIDMRENPTNTLVAAVIADPHVGPYKGERFVQDIVDHIVQIQPDVVFVAGDFVYDNPEQAVALKPFSSISRVYPVYAVLGNHDYDLASTEALVDVNRAGRIAEILRGYGIVMLNNDGLLLPRHEIWLAGIEDIWSRRARIGDSLYARPMPTPPTILLAHNPDVISFMHEAQAIDLVIAGHTHGGQIRLPLIGPVGKIPTELGQHFDKGLFEISGEPVFITSGIGESGPRARLFNFPEIAVLSIHY
jgi:uncharacterized protein